MKAQNRIRTAILLLIALFGPTAAAQDFSTARAARQVLVSIPDRKLAVLEGGKVLRTFPVAVGATVSPSPSGEFKIVNRIANPTYYHPGVVIPAGAGNPIGTRWLGLNRKGYGIHGTNEPGSIGKAASHGCIRLRNRDMEQLFRTVSVGDTVLIRVDRDEQVAEIFGRAPVTQELGQAQEAAATLAGEGQ
jgi:lipoprotein-anchoring transpeptidase ErfK/SrfK